MYKQGVRYSNLNRKQNKLLMNPLPSSATALFSDFFLCVCVCNKVLLKYKGDRESFWHKHQLIKIFPTLDMASCFSLVYISFFPQKIRTLHRHFRLYSDVLKLDISGLMIIIYLFSNYFCCCSSYTLKVLPVLKFISLTERVPLQEE